MPWTTVQNSPAAPRGMVKPQRCSICREIVPMQLTHKHDREVHRPQKETA